MKKNRNQIIVLYKFLFCELKNSDQELRTAYRELKKAKTKKREENVTASQEIQGEFTIFKNVILRT